MAKMMIFFQEHETCGDMLVDLEQHKDIVGSSGVDASSGREKGVHIQDKPKFQKFVIAKRSSSRLVDKNEVVLDKAMTRKENTFQQEGMPLETFSIFNTFDPLHLASVAAGGGLVLGNKDVEEEK
jgi:hypothetical protein